MESEITEQPAEGIETPDTQGTETGEGNATATPVEGQGAPLEGQDVDEKVATEAGEGLDEEALGEHLEGEFSEGEQEEGEHVEGESKEKLKGEEILSEGEIMEGEEEEEEGEVEEHMAEEEEMEEEEYEEPPVDPAAPYNFSDSNEALKAPFELRPDQLAEVEQLWEVYQDYTPAYTDISGYVTETELVYMLKCLNLMTYTAEQLQELIDYCCRPLPGQAPPPEGHIWLEHFVKMVTIRQRDFPIEEELRLALEVMDPEHTGLIDREQLKVVLVSNGHKMPQKQMENFVKEVDMTNDGTIGIDDVVGTLCIDLNTDDINMLLAQMYPPDAPTDNIDNLL